MNNSPGVIEHMLKWLALYLPSIYAGLSALGISALIDIRAGKAKLYTATGSLICGIFAVAISAMLEHLGLPPTSGAFVGAIVGFVGADKLRDVALSIVAKRAGVSSTEENK